MLDIDKILYKPDDMFENYTFLCKFANIKNLIFTTLTHVITYAAKSQAKQCPSNDILL